MPRAVVHGRWMRGSPLKGALLAVLLELGEPAYPYRLATLLARRLGPAARVDHRLVYKMLDPLEEAGLVALELRESETGSWRRQKMYRPTELTETAVDEWMASAVPYAVAREDLQVRVAVSRPSDAGVLLRLLDAFEVQCMDQLAECEAFGVPAGRWAGVAMGAAWDWTDEHVRADLSWIMKTRESILDHVAHGEI